MSIHHYACSYTLVVLEPSENRLSLWVIGKPLYPRRTVKGFLLYKDLIRGLFLFLGGQCREVSSRVGSRFAASCLTDTSLDRRNALGIAQDLKFAFRQ